MDKAKQSVANFMSKSGHHDTTVHEKVAPAVVNENITKERHEEVQTAIDREVHQDHYHTSVQPVKDREVLPEQHQHNMVPVEHREHKHGKDRAIAESLDQERAHFKDTRTQGSTHETHANVPTVAGEHVHHHVHETIQPVVQKETIQPSVVHTTVPIHEVHENDPKHHAASALPAVSMADFKKQGGTLGGREEKFDGFAGEPKSLTNLGGSAGHHGTHGTHTGSTTSGPHDSNLANKADPRVDSDRDGSRNAGMTQAHGSGTGSYGTGAGTSTTGHGTGYNAGPHDSNLANKADPRVDSDRDGSRGLGTGSGVGTGGAGTHIGTRDGTTHGTTHGSHGNYSTDYPDSSHGMGSNTTGTTTGAKKPSLMDKLNPKKDADGDGKPGFMK